MEKEWAKYSMEFLLDPSLRETRSIPTDLLHWLVKKTHKGIIQKAANKEITARRIRMLVDQIVILRKSQGRPYKVDGFEDKFAVAAQNFPYLSPDAVRNIYKSTTGKNDLGVPDPMDDIIWSGRQLAIATYIIAKKTWDITDLPDGYSMPYEDYVPQEWVVDYWAKNNKK